jgi:hypothetical protein
VGRKVPWTLNVHQNKVQQGWSFLIRKITASSENRKWSMINQPEPGNPWLVKSHRLVTAAAHATVRFLEMSRKKKKEKGKRLFH